MIHVMDDVELDLGDLGPRFGRIEGELYRDVHGVLYCKPESVIVFVSYEDGKEFEMTRFLTRAARRKLATEIEESFEQRFLEPDCMALAKTKLEEEICNE